MQDVKNNCLSLTLQIHIYNHISLPYFQFSRLQDDILMVGRSKNANIYLDSATRKGLISRAHSRIIKNSRTGNYEILDTSLNGTFVNDVRVQNSVILNDGDKITFGHLRGAVIEPGAYAPQKETEFLFVVSLNLFVLTFCDF